MIVYIKSDKINMSQITSPQKEFIKTMIECIRYGKIRSDFDFNKYYKTGIDFLTYTKIASICVFYFEYSGEHDYNGFIKAWNREIVMYAPENTDILNFIDSIVQNY